MTLPVPNFENVPPSNETTLAASISDSDASLTVAPTGAGADYPTTDFEILVEDEVLFIASRTGDVFTVATIGTDGFDGRGFDGTTAASHGAGERVQHVFAARDLVNAWSAYGPDQDDQLSSLAEKVAPDAADLVLLEDSAASGAKKKVQAGNLGGGGGAVPAESVIARLFAAPATVAGLTRTYDAVKTDEFDDASIAGKWIQVDAGPGGAVTWIEEAHQVGHSTFPPLAPQGIHALMQTIPAGDFYMEAAIRAQISEVNAMGVLFADGVTPGAGSQQFVGAINVGGGVWTYGNDPTTNYTGSGGYTGVLDTLNVGEVWYVRAFYNSGANTFDQMWSMDGITWLKYAPIQAIAMGFTPTHIGIGSYLFATNEELAIGFEYFRVYTEV